MKGYLKNLVVLTRTEVIKVGDSDNFASDYVLIEMFMNSYGIEEVK